MVTKFFKLIRRISTDLHCKEDFINKEAKEDYEKG
jgi:hypothetical protein